MPLFLILCYIIVVLLITRFLLNQGLLSHPVTFLILNLPGVIFCMMGLLTNHPTFVFRFLIGITLGSFFTLGVCHLWHWKQNIISHISTRYFYILAIIIYLYVFLSINGKNSGTSAGMGVSLSSLIILIFCLGFLFIMSMIKKEPQSEDRALHLAPLLLSIVLLVGISIFLMQLQFYDYLKMMIILALFPQGMRVYYMSKHENYPLVFSTCIGNVIFAFFLFALLDFFFSHIPITYYYDTVVHQGIQLGLFSSLVLILPSLKRFNCSYWYHLFAFIILFLSSLYLV